MSIFHYALIRFVPNAERMEPINIGVVVQGGGKIAFKLSPHVAKRKDIDTQIYQKWRKFFELEISGPAVPLFQPPKDSPDFIRHLGSLCENTITITRPLIQDIREQISFEEALESIYDRLVAPAETKKKQPERPTSYFRQFEEEKEFRKRGMKKHPYIAIPSDSGNRHWNAFRQVLNGQDLVIDKIEVGNSVGLTADEIQKLSSGAGSFLAAFLTSPSPTGRPPRYCLIADQLAAKFSEQTDEDYLIMQEELQNIKETVRVKGGEVLDQPNDVIAFAEDIDRHLPELEVA
ncbi:MAG: DUF3037 domain-containing protein [Planctomycetales bacterium]|nr:DUF3037 domain-containing protein [Planctomycetales bacterium]